MPQVIGLVVIIVVVALGIWIMTGGAERAAGQPPVRWMVQLEKGKVLRFEGAFPPVGWRDVHDIAMSRGVSGVIRFRGPGAIEFSDEIAEPERQRFRNLLNLGPGSGCIPGPKG